MSQENVEIVRAHFDAFNHGDIAQCVDDLHDDVELVVSPSLPEPGRYVGREATAAWFGNYFGSFASYTFRVEKIFEAANGVVVIARHHWIGRTSGIASSGESAYIYRVRDARIAQVVLYRDRAEALEAVGLSE